MKIFVIIAVLFIILFGDFSIAEAQNIVNGTAFEQDYGQDATLERDFDFQPLPEDPGVEVAPLPENTQTSSVKEHKTETDIIIDDVEE